MEIYTEVPSAAAQARDVRTTAFRACRQQDFAVMIDRAAKAGQG
jgi:hypothetical protein